VKVIGYEKKRVFKRLKRIIRNVGKDKPFNKKEIDS
jgi:hypothetical protein